MTNKDKALLDAAKVLHKTGHACSPFVTCETGGSDDLVVAKFASAKEASDFHMAFCQFFMTNKPTE